MKIVKFTSTVTVQNLLDGAIVTLVIVKMAKASITNVAMNEVLIVDNTVHFHYYLLCDFADLFWKKKKRSLCLSDCKMAIERHGILL